MKRWNLTLEEHDELMKTARRPITQSPIRLRRRRDENDIPAELSLVDRYIADHPGGADDPRT